MLRYFKKPGNAAAEDVRAQDDTSHTASSSTAQNDASSQPLASTEVSLVSAEGQIDRPVLTDDDETFLRRAVSEEEPPPLPPRPDTGVSDTEGDATNLASTDTGNVSTDDQKEGKGATAWRDRWTQYRESWDRTSAANDLLSAAETFKASSEAGSDNESETKREQRDVKSILSRMDLSAINNRVVGVSNETQKLLESFNQVLKDIINGVPTAYGDLDKLLHDRQAQLDKLFGTLPPFLQKLVKSMPTKMYASFAPQVAAAMAAGKSAAKEDSEKEDSKDALDKDKKKKLLSFPTLKDLVTRKGAVVAMLRSIISFLETRFPSMLVGTNVVMSLAVFVLLFVFWYCHKRGRESRLAKEQAESLENSTSDLEGGVTIDDSGNQRSAEKQQHLETSSALDAELEKKVDLLAQEIEKKP